jgi:hypothetical protein
VGTREGSIETGDGDVTLRLGRLAPFELRAATQSGKVVASDESVSRIEDEEAAVVLRRRQGGAELRVTSTKGDIRLRRHETL